MAGIGITLQHLLTQDRLGSQARGYLHAAVIAAGPWLLTSAAIALMLWMGQGLLRDTALIRFSGVSILAFSVSLVVAAPAALVLSRSLADAVYRRNIEQVSSMLFQALTMVFTALALIGALLMGVVVELPPLDRVLGFALLMACGGVWTVSATLAALRSYRSITTAFVVGLATACLVAYFSVFAWRTSGLLFALVMGLTVAFFMLLARVLAEFPAGDATERRAPFRLGAAMRRHRGLAWAALFYAAALWVDKWMMWVAPGALGFGRGIYSHAAYQGAMFIAGLTIVPALVLLLIEVETRFHDAFRLYQREIARGGTLHAIRRQHGVLVRLTASSLRRLLLLQAAVAAVVVLAAPSFLAWFAGGADMVSILRFGAIGAAFHAVLIAQLSLLAYCDQQRWMVWTTATFFVGNVLATGMGMALGEAYHGWGYAVSTVLAAAVGFVGASRTVVGLPYVSFISANQAVREPRLARRSSRSRRPHSRSGAASVLASEAGG